jgi:hypothetical protein
MNKLIIIALSVVYLKIQAQNTPPTYVDLKNKIGLIEGTYDLVSGSEESCQGSQVEIKWELDSQQALLRIGDRFLIPHLNKSQAIEDLPVGGCVDKTKNITKLNYIEQTMDRSCRDKKMNFSQLQKVEVQKNKVTYLLEKKSNKKSSLQCVYQLIQLTGGTNEK